MFKPRGTMKGREIYYFRGGQTPHVFHCPTEDARVVKSTLTLKHKTHTLRSMKHKEDIKQSGSITTNSSLILSYVGDKFGLSVVSDLLLSKCPPDVGVASLKNGC